MVSMKSSFQPAFVSGCLFLSVSLHGMEPRSLNTPQKSMFPKVLEQVQKIVDLKKHIAATHQELTMVYHAIGVCIGTYQVDLGWSLNKIINQLREDFEREVPGENGLNSRKLKYMYKFSQTYPDEAFVREAIMQLPWTHIEAVMERVREKDDQLSYMKKAIEGGWTCKMLIEQIKSEGSFKTKKTKTYDL